jgi:hypothetical protein
MAKSKVSLVIIELLVSLALAFAIVTTLTAIVAHSQTTFTDKNGHFMGEAKTYGNSTTFIDRNGQFTGTSITHGNSTSVYDRNGYYQGSVMRNGGKR